MRSCMLTASTSGSKTSQQSKPFPLNLTSTVCCKEHKPWCAFIQVPTLQLHTKSAAESEHHLMWNIAIQLRIRSALLSCGLCIPRALPWLGSKVRHINTGGEQLPFCYSWTSAHLPCLYLQTAAFLFLICEWCQWTMPFEVCRQAQWD